MSLINPKVAQVFANDTQQMKFIAAGIEQLLGEEKTEALISEIMPETVKPAAKYKGQLLAIYNGLSRNQLKLLHGFTDEQVDEVYALMGVNDVKVKTAAEVNREAVESAGTASERADVQTTTEGQTEAQVDAASTVAVPVTEPAQPVSTPVSSSTMAAAKANQAKNTTQTKSK